MTTEESLKVKNLKVYYKMSNAVVRAVDNVTFALNKKEILGIVGESGCGKSTLVLGILRLVRPPCYVEGGEVLFDGVNLLDLGDETLRRLRWSRISYVPQSSMNALNPVMRIGNQMIDAIKAHEPDTDRDKALSSTAHSLEIVGLPPETINMFPHELSGGMRQRAIIAISTILNPSIIIADEPTTALDVVVQRIVIEHLREIREKKNVSMIYITHDMAVQAEISDRLLVMYAGKIAEISDTKEAFKEPLHPYTSALIKATPALGTMKTLEGLEGLPPSLINPPKGCRFQSRCPKAFERCAREEPALLEANDGRLVACHLYGGN